MTSRDQLRLSLHWWEKTIEYAFVRQMLPQSSLAVPMAGSPEAALSDILLLDDAKFRLIEFKARRDSIHCEKRKFPELRKSDCDGMSFQRALLERHDTLVGHDGAAAHWFVFGEQVGDKLLLKAQKYCEEGAHFLLPGQLSLPAVSRAVMVDYMSQLAAAREREHAVSGSGGMVYCAVSDDSLVALPAEEFLRIACPELQISQEGPDSEPEGSTPAQRPSMS